MFQIARIHTPWFNLGEKTGITLMNIVTECNCSKVSRVASLMLSTPHNFIISTVDSPSSLCNAVPPSNERSETPESVPRFINFG
jgi:hypothetical protein